MQPRTNPASSSRIAERRQARRSPTVLRIVGRPRPRNVAWLATWVAVLVAGYQFGVHFALDAVREAMSASDAAGAELPQNIFRWDQPELAPIHEKRLEELHRATSIEPVLQFWLPALLAIGLGSAVAMTAVIAPLAPRAGAGRVRLRAARLRYLQVGLLAVLASALFASAASEFLARWRPRDFPPEWSTWLASLTAPASLWIRAGLPLFLGSALVGIGFRLFRRARRHEETLCLPPPQIIAAQATGGGLETGQVVRPRFQRIAARTSRLRLLGLMLICATLALDLADGLRELRGPVPDGRFDSELMRYFERTLGPQTRVRTDVLLLGQIPLVLGLCLVIAAPRLAALPLRRHSRAAAGRCQRCGVFLMPQADHCWDCGEVVRCAECLHALRADQATCSECGTPRVGCGAAAART
jgi:hypothetical protein